MRTYYLRDFMANMVGTFMGVLPIPAVSPLEWSTMCVFGGGAISVADGGNSTLSYSVVWLPGGNVELNLYSDDLLNSPPVKMPMGYYRTPADALRAAEAMEAKRLRNLNRMRSNWR